MDIQQTLCAIIETFTPSSLEENVQQIRALSLDDPPNLNYLSNLILRKVLEDDIAKEYAMLCAALQEIDEFKVVFIDNCKTEFEKVIDEHIQMKLRHQESLMKTSSVSSNDESSDIEEEKKLRCSTMRLCNFIGELFLTKILASKAVCRCIDVLLTANDDFSLDCLCTLLNTCGKQLEEDLRAKGSEAMDFYFSSIQVVTDHYLKFRISDEVAYKARRLAALREMTWYIRVDVETPTQTNEAKKEALNEIESGRKSQQGKKRICKPPQVIHESVSLKGDVLLHQSEDAWKPSRLNPDNSLDDEIKKTETLYKAVRSILNKVTQEKLPLFVEKINVLPIDNMSRLEGVADLMHQKAIHDPGYCRLYAELCHTIQPVNFINEDTNTGEALREILLNKCQNELEREKAIELDSEKHLAEIKACNNPKKKKELQLEFEEMERKIRRKSVGNCRFIGELFKLEMLTPETMIRYVNQLLSSLEEKTLECLCVVLTNVGKDLEMKLGPSGPIELEKFFGQMQEIINDKKNKVSSRIRFMLLNVIDFRKNKWVPRLEADNRETLDEMDQELEREKPVLRRSQRIAIRSSRESRTGKNCDGKPPQQNQVPLHQSEDAWKPSRLNPDNLLDDETKKTVTLLKAVRSILNKVTEEKLPIFKEKIVTLPIDTLSRLEDVVDLIHQKAIHEPGYCRLYAELCRTIQAVSVTNEATQTQETFRKILLDKCQNEFQREKAVEWDSKICLTEIKTCHDPEKKKMLQLEFEEMEGKMRRKFVGNVRFIVELFKLQMLTAKIVARRVAQLLGNLEEKSLESLCKVLTIAGKDLEMELGQVGPLKFDKFFSQMQEIIDNKKNKVSSRIRFMLQDAIDLRRNKWEPRCKAVILETPDKIFVDRAFEEEKEDEKLASGLPYSKKTEKLIKKIRRCLNKLTPEQFPQVSRRLCALRIDNMDVIYEFIDMIFQKAVNKPGLCRLCAEICHVMQTQSFYKEEMNRNEKFTKYLINKCQKEFKREKAAVLDSEKRSTEIEACDDLEKKKELQLAFEKMERKMRQKSVGTCRLIGELFKLEMLTAKITIVCVAQLLSSLEEEALECLCVLLSIIGKDLEVKLGPSGPIKFDEFFAQMQEIIDDKDSKVSSRIRSMLLDVIDLRRNKWVPKHDVNNQETPDQMNQEFERNEKDAKETHGKQDDDYDRVKDYEENSNDSNEMSRSSSSQNSRSISETPDKIFVNQQSKKKKKDRTKLFFKLRNEKETEALNKTMRGFLAKLTPEQFPIISARLCSLPINNRCVIEGFIDIIFQKAIDEPGLCQLCAEICHVVQTQSFYKEEMNRNEKFKKKLLKKCRNEFKCEKAAGSDSEKRLAEIEACEDLEKKKELQVEFEEMERKMRQKSVSTCRLIGELFKLEMLPGEIIIKRVAQLLSSLEEESLECLCVLLSTIGKDLEIKLGRNGPIKLDKFFSQLQEIIDDKENKVSSRIRFMLQDVIDLGRNQWVPKHEANDQETPDQMNQEFEEKEKDAKEPHGTQDDDYSCGRDSEENSNDSNEMSRKSYSQNTCPISREGSVHRVPPLSTNTSQSCTVSSGPPKIEIDVLRRYCKTILKEFALNNNLADSIAAIEERVNPQQVTDALECFISISLEKDLADTCGKLFVALFERKSISLSNIVHVLRTFIEIADDIVVEFPLYWYYIGQALCELFFAECFKYSEFETTFVEMLPEQRNGPFLLAVNELLDESGFDRESQPVTKCDDRPPQQIQVSMSLKDDVWKPSRLNPDNTPDDETQKTETLYKAVRSIFNKVTEEKLPLFAEKINMLPIDNMSRLEGVADLIHQKAIHEPGFCRLYAELCHVIQAVNFIDEDTNTRQTLRKILLNKCQNEFQREKAIELDSKKHLAEIKACTDPEKKKELQLKFEEMERKMRRKSVGNCRFIGELFKREMLTPKTMIRYVAQLFSSLEEESLECLCVLLSTTGNDLEMKLGPSGPIELDKFFSQMQDIVNDKKNKLSSRIRFMLQDVVDLRRNKWVSRREAKNRKTLDQMNQEFERRRPDIKLANMRQRDEKTEALNEAMRHILDELTPKNFPTSIKIINMLPIDNSSRLEGVIDLIFQKAIDKPGFCRWYAEMCRVMQQLTVTNEATNSQETFRKILLNKCQTEFQREKAAEMDSEKRLAEIKACNDAEKKKELLVEFEEMERKMRQKSVGTCRFIGELFKLQMLTAKIMIRCVAQLLGSLEEESLECLCVFLSTIGKDLEVKLGSSGPLELDKFFSQMQEIIDDKENQVSSTMKSMLQDVIDLRRNKWVPEETPDQRDQEVERKEKNAKEPHGKQDDDYGHGRDFKENPKNDKDEWQTVTNKSSFNNKSINQKIDLGKLQQSIRVMAADVAVESGPQRGVSMWRTGAGASSGSKGFGSNSMHSVQSLSARNSLSSKLTPSNSTEEPRPLGMSREGMTNDSNEISRSSSSQNSRPISREGSVQRVPSSSRNASQSNTMSSRPPIIDKFVLERYCKTILEEFALNNDLADSIAAFEERVNPQQITGALECFINVIFKKTNLADTCGRLFVALFKRKSISLSNIVHMLRSFIEIADDILTDFPRFWDHLAETLCPLFTEDCLKYSEFETAFVEKLPEQRNGPFLLAVNNLINKVHEADNQESLDQLI